MKGPFQLRYDMPQVRIIQYRQFVVSFVTRKTDGRYKEMCFFIPKLTLNINLN